MCCLRVVSWRPCCRTNVVLCPKRGKVTEEIWLMARLFFPKGFDKLNLKLIIIIRLQVIVVYRTPSVLLGSKGNDILLLRSMWWKFPWNESRLTFWAHCHKTPQKNKFILVVSDYFAKWTESCPIPDQEATTVTKKLVSYSINLLFWCTLQLHSNQRINFELKVFDEVCRPLEIEKTCTTSTDRLSVFMEPSLKCYMGGSCNTWDWDLQLPACMMTYRGAVYESTWVLSNLLMLGTWMS